MHEANRSPAPALPGPGRSPIPGPFWSKVLLFEFLVLVEYWLAPLLFGIDNYVGLWPAIGNLLFGVLMGTLAIAVLLPLRHRLREAFATPRLRWTFHALWAGSVLVGLFATATFRLEGAGTSTSGSPLTWGWENVSTPFGTWGTLVVSYAPAGFVGALNVEVLGLLSVLSVLWASVVVLGMARPSVTCATPDPTPRSRWSRAASLAMWAPLGFMTGCAACTPVYVAALGLIAPGAALSAYNAIPLVPWIGLAGLLYTASLAITLRLLRRVTGPFETAPSAPALLAPGHEVAA